MSDLDHLDPRLEQAFEALTRELAHEHGPGAAAAVSTARRRRRTRAGAVALAAFVVAAGGLTAPRLLGPQEDGVASDGGSARLDAAALDRAAEGWISEWEAWELSEDDQARGGAASCFVHRIPAGAEPDPSTGWNEPQPVAGGESSFAGSRNSYAFVSLSRYDDATQAASAQEQVYPPADSCSDTTFIDVDGVQVRHDSMEREAPGVWETDVWSVQVGDERGEVMLHTAADPADDAIAERVAEALVAGLRDGWTQTGMKRVVAQPQVPQLPPFDDGELGRALDGWRSASRVSASGIPNTPCLGEQVDAGSVTGSSGGTPRGVTWSGAGFADDEAGEARIDAMLDELRACPDWAMSVEKLPNGVSLVTYEYGRPGGHGALWLAENGDRAGLIGVDGADRPMPDGTAEDVAAVLSEWLRLPWE